MNDGTFQWDDTKAAANYAEHGITFEMARKVFNDGFALDWPDRRERYGEERFCIVGMADDRLLFIAYTMRDDAIRIISARGAEPHERRRYHEHNS
jgi:uncharacterized DUF497 family protein